MLFKYVTSARIDILQHLRVRFTPASEFNDPFEFMPDTSVLTDPQWLKSSEDQLVRKALEVAILRPGITMADAEAGIRTRIQAIRQELEPGAKSDFAAGLADSKRSLRVLCLSRLAPDSRDALLMWAHYTNGHTGFVIGFHEIHPWITNHRSNLPFRDAGDVSYSPTRPKSVMGAHERSYYLVKSADWCYEGEVRLVRAEGDPELDAKSLAPLPAEVVASVTLGLNASDATQAGIAALLASDRRFSAVKLFHSEFHPDEYRVVLKAGARPSVASGAGGEL